MRPPPLPIRRVHDGSGPRSLPSQTRSGRVSGPHLVPSPPRASRRLGWYVGGAAVILLNAVAFKVYRSFRPAKVEPAAVATAAPVTPPEPVPAPESGVARAHRVAGLSALEEGDYSRAVKEFSSAARFGNAGADVPELLRIAKDLEDRKKKALAGPPPPVVAALTPVAPAPAPVAAPPPPAKAKEEPKPKPSSRAPEPRRKQAARSESSEEREPLMGTLLVTSMPSGLVVEVDGQPEDFTPARLTVDPGSHAVAIVQGDAKLFAKVVQVPAGGVMTVDADVFEKVEALARPKASAPAAVSQDDLEEPDAPEPVRTAPTSPGAIAGRGLGEVYVISPEVYGEIFINGRRYGFPPLLAKDVPAGKARVELRVNGQVRRALQVDVQTQRRATARIR